jgi:hypothetical protein
MFLNRENEIGVQGATKLGEGVSKLLNLTVLNLNFKLKFVIIVIYNLIST